MLVAEYDYKTDITVQRAKGTGVSIKKILINIPF